jgi:hypothetical protein
MPLTSRENVNYECLLKKIFGPRKDEAKEQFRILHTGKLHYLYKPPITVRIMKSLEDMISSACGWNGRDKEHI